MKKNSVLNELKYISLCGMNTKKSKFAPENSLTWLFLSCLEHGAAPPQSSVTHLLLCWGGPPLRERENTITFEKD